MKLAAARAKAGRGSGLKRAREMTLFDFRAPEDRAEVNGAKWRVWTDEIMGGRSTCSWSSSEDDGGKAVFEGTLSQYVPKGVSRSGYAAVQLIMPDPLKDVTEFDALQLRVKMDARRYVVNVKPESFIPDDLYQGFLMQDDPAMHGVWQDAILPFHSFLLMGRGLIKQDQRKFDFNIMETLGLMASEYEGDFKIEVQSAKVISFDNFNVDARMNNLRPAETTTSF